PRRVAPVLQRANERDGIRIRLVHPPEVGAVTEAIHVPPPVQMDAQLQPEPPDASERHDRTRDPTPRPDGRRGAEHPLESLSAQYEEHRSDQAEMDVIR